MGFIIIESNAPDAFVCSNCHRKRERSKLGDTIILSDHTGKRLSETHYCKDCLGHPEGESDG